MNRKALEAPFDKKKYVKKRKASFGKTVSYIETAVILRRLLDGTDGVFNFEIVEHKLLDREILVVAKLTIDGTSRMAFGGSALTTSKETGQPISIADDYKAAASDALKRCCRLYGVALELYSENGLSETHPPVRGNGKNGHGRNNSANEENNGDHTNGANGNRLTQKQLSAIWALTRKAGNSSDEIRKRSDEMFGVAPEFLSKADASTLIGKLSDELVDSAHE